VPPPCILRLSAVVIATVVILVAGVALTHQEALAMRSMNPFWTRIAAPISRRSRTAVWPQRLAFADPPTRRVRAQYHPLPPPPLGLLQRRARSLAEAAPAPARARARARSRAHRLARSRTLARTHTRTRTHRLARSLTATQQRPSVARGVRGNVGGHLPIVPVLPPQPRRRPSRKATVMRHAVVRIVVRATTQHRRAASMSSRPSHPLIPRSQFRRVPAP